MGVRKVGLTAAFALALFARPLSAYYEESHVTGDEARVAVDGLGTAHIEHTLAWHLVAGQPRAIELLGVEPSAKVEPSASLEADDGRMLPAVASVVEGHGLRVTIADPKALRHGHYRVRLAYEVDLPAAGELVRDGPMFRLAWKGPTPREGYDTARVTFVLPGALEEPRALIGEGGMSDDGVMSTLKRAPDHDELELVRPHVGKGQEVLWAVRIAARAFEAGRVPGPASRPPPPLLEPRGHDPWVVLAMLSLSLAFGVLVRWKERRFDRACAVFAERARGLVPLRSWERAALAGAALFVGLSLELADETALGTLAVVLAMACAALRPPRAVPPPRGPGLWLVLRPEEVFGSAEPRRQPDWDTLVFILAVLILFGVGTLLRSTQPQATLLLPLDAVALLPLVFTGRPSQLPPDLFRADRPWFRALFRRLSNARSLHASPWVRIPAGAASGDELRVLSVPRAPMPGLVGVEVGRAFVRTSASYASFPEVLVRVLDASPASSRMTSLGSGIVPLPGRRPEERVYRFVVSWPTSAAAASLVESLCQKLVDRRVAPATWEAEADRRVSPSRETALAPGMA